MTEREKLLGRVCPIRVELPAAGTTAPQRRDSGLSR